MQLVGGQSAGEGRAEVYRNGAWGTVCLDNLRRDNFPTVFCKDLGYDRAEAVTYAKTAYTGQGTGQ